jgi:hypothetical protein
MSTLRCKRFMASASAHLSLLLLFGAASCGDQGSEGEPSDAAQDPASSHADASTISASLDAGAQDATAGDTLDAHDGHVANPPESRDASNEMEDARVKPPLDASPATSDAASDGGAAGKDASPGDPENLAGALNGLFIDAPCAPNTPTPLAQSATCQHPGTTQHIDQKLTFAGKAGTTYEVKLRVRGIWEPTFIQGGTRPYGKMTPFTVGGTVATGTGDPINYQQYLIQVSEPKQTYWLNDYQYVAHDIHKEDYEATLRIAGNASVTVSMSDGNDHEIANWTRDYFQGLAPYDKAPSTGQLLRLDVISVTAL